MAFTLPAYREPDFSDHRLASAPNASWAPVEMAGVAPRGFHSTSMHPEYLKVDGEWVLVDGIAMDDVIRMRPDGRIQVVPERMLKLGDKVALGRTEDGEDGVYVWADGFVPEEEEAAYDALADRLGAVPLEPEARERAAIRRVAALAAAACEEGNHADTAEAIHETFASIDASAAEETHAENAESAEDESHAESAENAEPEP